ncbi:branched-chain amino acid transporter AzlC [Aminipila butyrica]|uniref:Branched-chain amino acid transporter AzlC n=1 Tax=Aminipila butyrica TaxID=433296 RepID=A0A858BVF2_9FIRM|nr:AzlC family ABC transporter permease [Aminipila butyrica]QIB68744.1 branched-chain amino acid transporter AzlC [Aminipila butyrica]
MSQQKIIKKALFAAFPYTIPIFAGFVFLGVVYGIYMNTAGFNALYPMVMAAIIFAGSMEFVATNLLLVAFDPLRALVLTLLVNARHLFYGISMLDKYNGTGWKKWFLIFGMCDESFSINCSVIIPPGVDKGWFMFFITLLNYLYWVCGATIGGLLGPLVQFNTDGLDFVMTALFVVIFLDQWLKKEKHYSSLIGLGVTALCLIVFGPENFIIPAMLGILFCLSMLRKFLEKEEPTDDHDLA